MKQLQDVFGYKKTKTTLYRPQGNPVSERMFSTLHAMLSMYSNMAQNNWAEILPFMQLAHNTSFSSMMHETPFFLMFGRQARLPINIIFGIPHFGRSTMTEEFAHSTRENLRIAFELARRNLSERIDKQKANNFKLPPIPEFTPGQKGAGIQTSSQHRWTEPEAYPAMAWAVHNMFQIVTSGVSNPTPR